MTQIIVRNSTTLELEFDTLGISIPASGTFDMTYIDQQHRSNSQEFLDAIGDGRLLVIRSEDPETYWEVSEATLLLTAGINKTIVGLDKVKNVLHNYEALNPPNAETDETLGYSVGSIWIINQGSFRAWVCAYAGAGMAVWGELTQPPIHPGVVENRYYGASVTAPLVSDNLPPDRLAAVPFAYPTATNWNRIGVDVTTPISGGVARLGIYSNLNGRPNNLLLDAGFITLDTIGKKEIIINFQNPADWFWLVIVASQEAWYLSIDGEIGGDLFGVADPENPDGGVMGLTRDFPYGTLPANYTGSGITIEDARKPPYIWLRRV